MSMASRAVKRLRGLYRFVFRRMRQHEARLFGGLGRPGGGRLCGEGISRSCRIEQLEPRLMLDAVGPQVAAHWPTGLVAPADHVDITFNEPINPATLSADDVLVMRSSPMLLGGYDTAGNARGVALAGDIAYVADYQAGLQILDVSDPAAPVRLGGYDTAGNALIVDVSGNLAYVADYTSGLQIIDVSNPAAPVRLGGYDTPGVSYSVAVSGTTAYVADFFLGLQIIDVSIPAAPVLLGNYDTAGFAYGVAVSGTTAYVADRHAGLQIIDVSNPAAPVLLGTCDTTGSAYAVTVVGTRAYVADDTAGLQIIDVSDPAAPVLMGTYDTAGNAYGASVSGRLAYVSDGTAGLQVIDVSDPSAPVLLSAYDTASLAYGVAVSGGVAYVADGAAGVQVVEVASPVGGVTAVDATTYRVNLAGMLGSGTYNVSVYPTVTDLAGNPMDQDGDGTGGELPDDMYTFSFAVEATPPTSPGNLAFADDTGMFDSDNLTSDSELLFTWSASTDANGIAGYEYCLNAGVWTPTADLFAIVPVTEGEHTFEVRAVDNPGNPGFATALVVTVDLTAPSAPANLTRTLGDLSWDAATDAHGIWKYQYRLDGGAWIDSPTTSADGVLFNGQTATVDLRAVDAASNAGPATTATFTYDHGPSVVGHAPDGVIPAPTDHVDVTFDKLIDPSTFTVDDVQVIPSELALLGNWSRSVSYYTSGIAVSGTLAYVAHSYLGLYVLDVSNPAAPVELGRYDTADNALGVTLSGNFAYVADRSSGLQIINISNPAAPTLRGSYDTTGSATEVAVSGSLAYVADGASGLQIIDVSNPTAPVLVGGYDTSGYANGVALSSTLAYVADGKSGLVVLDVSNPAAPVLVGGYDTSGEALGVAVSGTLAYVADDTGGLQIIDVTNPASPVRTGGYAGADTAKRVAIAGTFAYVTDYSDGLHVIDVSDSSAPVRLGGYDTPGGALGLFVMGNTAYVADYYSGIQIIETSRQASSVTQVGALTYRIDLPTPLSEGTYHFRVGPDVADLSGNLMDQNGDGLNGQPERDKYAFSLTVDTQPPSAVGDLAFADNTGGSDTDNVTSDTTLAFTWSASTDLNGIARYEYRWDEGQWVASAGLGVSIAAGEGEHAIEVRAVDLAGNMGVTTLREVIVDTTAPPAPTGLRLDGRVLRWGAVADTTGIWKYQYRVNGGGWSDAADNSASTGLAEGAGASFEVRAVDQAGNIGPLASADLTADYGPQVVSHSPDGVFGDPVDHFNIVFSEPIDPSTFTAEDVRINPASLLHLSNYDTPGNTYNLQVIGTLAYVADSPGLRILDVSDPASPVEVGFCDLGGVRDVKVVGSLAYMAAYNSGLRIVDVSDPTSPVEIGACDSTDRAVGIDVVGDLAYVAHNWQGIQIFDVSDPAEPVLIGKFDTEGAAQCEDVQVVGDLAYLADRTNGLRILDVSDPAAPVEVGYFVGGAYAEEVQVVGTLAYVAKNNSGLLIIDVSDPAAPFQVSYYNLPDEVEDLQVVGNLAYIANGRNGLGIVDISSPAMPFEVVYYDTPGDALGVWASGNVVYVADDVGGVQIIEAPRGAVSSVTQLDATTWRIDLAEPLTNGEYTINVGPRVTDVAGNTMDQNADGVGGEPSDDVYSFGLAVDQTPPTVPANLIFADDTGVSNDDSLTADTTLTFSWSASTDLHGVAGYEYRIDGGTWTAAIGMSAAVTPAEGEHTFEVRAVDVVGNAGEAASLTVTVDTTAPPAPTGLAIEGAVLGWDESADANGIWKYQYRIDGGDWGDSLATSAATGVADGVEATFEVRAVDVAGNAGPASAATFAVDHGPRIVSREPDSVVGPISSFTVTFNEPVDPATFSVDDLNILLPAPVYLGGHATNYYTYDVAVSGNLAYVADYYTGLKILDVSDPTQPEQIAVYDTPGIAVDLAMSGNIAYVACYDRGLQIIDVSDPTAPRSLGSIPPVAGSHPRVEEVTVSDGLLYLGDNYGGTVIYDISDPASPIFRSSTTNTFAADVVTIGNHAYVAGAYWLNVFDISDPAAPVILGSYRTSGKAVGLAIRDSLAYVATYDAELVILDISDPTNPTLAASHTLQSPAMGMTMFGDWLFVPGYRYGLSIIDVLDPLAPELARTYDMSDRCPSVTISGNRAYVTNEEGGLKILQVFQDVSGLTQVNDTTWRVDLPSPLTEGTHGLRIGPGIADLAGNTMDQNADGVGGLASEDRYAVDIVVDTTPPPAPPDLALASDTGPADNVTAATDLEFTWSAPADIAGIGGYEYRLDGGAWALTAGPSGAVTATEGGHTFEVRAIDGVGNVGPATSLDVVVDLTAPEAPTGLRLDGAVLRWDAAADANGIWKYQYRAAGDDWADSLETQATTGLADGASGSFDVRAVDIAGNIGPWASATLTADYGPLAINHSPNGLVAGPINHIDVTFSRAIDPASFSADDVRIIASAPVRVGGYDTDGSVFNVAISGDIAYVADWDMGLKILDVSNPVVPVLLGTYIAGSSYAIDVAVSGNLAYLAYFGEGLQILDVSDPSAPVLVGAYTAESAYGVTLSGDLAYVMQFNGGLTVLDVSDPSAPVRLGGYSVNSYGYGIVVSDDLVYLADGSDGLNIIDVSNPAAPFLVSTYDPSYSIRGVAVVGDVAYVNEYGYGMRILDVSDPVSPVAQGLFRMTHYMVGMAVRGTLAYVAGTSYGLEIVDVSDPLAPVLVDSYDTSGSARSVTLSGPLAYVADSDGGLQIIDVPWAEVAGVTRVNDFTFRVELDRALESGSYHVMVGPDVTDQAGNTMDQDGDGIGGEALDDVYSFDFTVDATAPQAPTGLALTNDTGSADNVTSATELAFEWSASSDLHGIAGYEYRLDGGDWTPTVDLSAGVTAGEGTHTFQVRAIDGVGNAGFVASLDVVVDLTAPGAPTGLGINGALLSWDDALDANGIWKYQFRIDGGDWIDSPTNEAATGLAEGAAATFEVRAVDKAGNIGPITAAGYSVDYGPRVINHSPTGLVSSPDSLTLIFNEPIDPATFTPDDVRVALDVPVILATWSGGLPASTESGDLLYTVSGATLNVFDVSDPTAPVLLGFCALPAGGADIFVRDHVAYVAASSAGLAIVDVADPAGPVLIGTCATMESATDIDVAGDLAYVVVGRSGIQIIDVSDLTAPAIISTYDPSYNASFDVAVAGDFAYLAVGYGLDVVDVSDPAAPFSRQRISYTSYVDSVIISGDLMYTANWGTLKVYDISEPGQPHPLGQCTGLDSADRMGVFGTMLYAAGFNGFQVFDINDPASPVHVSGFFNELGNSSIMAVAGDHAYVFGSRDNFVLQLSEPMANIEAITQVDAVTYRVDFTGPLTDGTHHIRIGPGVTDLAGNVMDQDGDGVGGKVSSDVFAFAFTADSTPPTAPPGLTLTTDTGSADGVTTATDLAFTWSPASDAYSLAGYEYRLDGGDWTWTVDRLGQVTADEGPHTIEVRAVDGAGNPGPATALDVAVDLTAPAAPTGFGLDGAVLHWDEPADANGIWKYQYSIDGGNWATAVDRQVSTGLAEGSALSFEIRAIDKAGNVGPWASADLTVDYGPRVVGHSPDGLVGLTNSLTLTFNEPIDPATLTSDEIQLLLATPTFLGTSSVPDTPRNFAVSEDLVFVAADSEGLQIYDVSDPSAPVHVGGADYGSYVGGVGVLGDLAFVGDSFYGLHVYDVSNPAEPIHLSIFDTIGGAADMVTRGNLVYTASSDIGGIGWLQIIDMSYPAAPALVGQCNIGACISSIALSGNTAYVPDAERGLNVIDVSNPAAPVLLARIALTTKAYDVAVSGNIVYLANNTAGLVTVDVSDPAAPVILGAYDTPDEAYRVAVSGTIAYVADKAGGLQVIDASDPAAPTYIGSYASYVSCVALSDDKIYVGRNNNLEVLDMSIPLAGISGVTHLGGSTYRVDLAEPLDTGDYYIRIGPGVTDLAGNTMDQDGDGVGGESPDDQYTFSFTVDTTLPSMPGNLTLVNDTGASGSDGITAETGLEFTWSAATDDNGIAGYEYRLDGGAWALTAGLSATVTAGEGSHVFEVRAVDGLGNVGGAAIVGVTVDTAGPRVVGHSPDGTVGAVEYVEIAFDEAIDPATVTAEDVRVLLSQPARLGGVDTDGYAYGAVVVGTTAYVADDHHGLQIVDVSDPAAPVWLGGYDTSGNARGVAVAGTTAYVADGFQGLIVIDVTDPAAPVRLGGFDTAGYAYDVVVAGGLAYVADDTGGLQIVDVSNPAAPVLLGGYDTSGNARGVTLVGSVAYVADEAAGLQIVDVSNPAALVRLGGYDTAGNAYAVAVSGTVAYVADYTAGLQIIDVANPAAPVRVGGYNTPGFARDVAVAGGLVYVADDYCGLQIIDPAIPSAPQLLAVHDTPGNVRTVAAADGLAYLADGYGGLEVVDVQRPVTNITQADDVTFRAEFAGALTAGDYTVRVGPKVADIAGNLMDQDANGTGGEVADVLTFGFTTTGPAPAHAPAPVARATAFLGFLAPGTIPAGSAFVGPLPPTPVAAAFADPDELAPSPAAATGPDAANSTEPLAGAAAVTPPSGFVQFLCAPANIDLLCDSPMPPPSLIQPSTQADPGTVDLLGLEPTALEVIPALLPA